RKGLEYPVVFLPSLGAIAHDPARSTTFDVRERDRRVLYLDPKHPDAPRTQREIADLRELLRLAYVGLTRAKHMCVIHAQLPDGTMNRKRAFRSPLASLLLGTGEFESDFAKTVAAIAENGDDEAFRAPFVDVPKLVAVRGPRTQTRPPVAREAEDVGPLAVRTITRTPFVDTLYRFSSFTSVVAAGEAPAEAGQKDEAETNAPSLPRPAVEQHLRVALAGLPGGKNLGNLVHEVLEALDFRAPETLDALIGARLARYGVPEDPYRQTLDAALRDMLMTPLLTGDPSLTLSNVASRDTLRELAFTFPVAGGLHASSGRVLPRALAQTFLAHPRATLPVSYAARVAGLQSAPLRGFFHGSIDLVVRHAGLYYVVDYKTNNLGDAIDDYSESRLTSAMMESHYPLQAHVYGVAMHRHLSRVLAGYDYDTHFGGFLYLFVRGMSEKTGASRGVYADRPPRAHIEALDALLRDGEVSR
ncbi:MAG: PD-(D/E)XK nuclease family protein, partial [Myxococcales bacterium]|nr:PD-(D/E)XK nuclease family protein [Myxococcales bacterium]